MADWLKEWAIVVSAGVTLLLAIAAFWTIRQNYSLRKKERRERLLNEIIEWADDIRKSSSESIDPNEIIFDDPTMQIASQQVFQQLRRKYQSLNTKSAYMKEAISKVFGINLLSAVEKVIKKLNEAIKMLGTCITSKAKENSAKVEEYKKSLDNCTEELIKEATKIKTKGVS
jgi:hypothetical protein